MLWFLALVLCPTLGVLAGVAASTTAFDSDALAWALLFGVPPVLALILGWALDLRTLEFVAGAALSIGAAGLGLLAFSWYPFEVGDFLAGGAARCEERPASVDDDGLAADHLGLR